MRRLFALSVAFLLGWQVGGFACTCINPGEYHGCCQAPRCRDYAQECPPGWTPGQLSQSYSCCRAYTGSHRMYGDPPCCEWIDGCAHFRCIKPDRAWLFHCKRWNTTPKGNWKAGDYWICEGDSGGAYRCSEKAGACKKLEE